MRVTISPLFSSDCSTLAAGCADQAITDTDTITIKNKKRDKFQIKVGGGLTLQNVVIDSLDSLVCKSAFKLIIQMTSPIHALTPQPIVASRMMA
jgi:hypothetical protein